MPSKRNLSEAAEEIVPHPRVLRTVAEWRAIGVPDYWLDLVWRRYVVGPDHGQPYYSDSAALPGESGVYFLWSEDWALLYVGMSNEIRCRIANHVADRRIPFRYVIHIAVDTDLAPYVEKAYIDALQPPYNRKYDISHWDGHARMVRLIERIWRRALRPATADACAVSM